MFRISRRLDYGLQLMLALSKLEKKSSFVPTALLSEELEIPLPFLHQISHSLMQSGLIKATPGPRGGLRISKAADKITLFDIFEALEGGFSSPTLADTETPTSSEESEAAAAVWVKIGDDVHKMFSSILLSDIIEKK